MFCPFGFVYLMGGAFSGLAASPLRSLGETLEGQYLMVEAFKEGTRKSHNRENKLFV